MFKGFYNLTSGMVSQGRRLDVVSNNMTNVSTTGYRAERYTDSTFRDVMFNRLGNLNKADTDEIGTQSYILAPSVLYTDFTQGTFDETHLPLDFAIVGDGFFAVELNGEIGYTRSGSFTLDNEGYLCLSEFGRVLDNEGNPIQLGTDQIRGDKNGDIYSSGGTYLATLGVYAFENNDDLERSPLGLFVGDGAQINPDAQILHKWTERSNVSMIQEMVNMITSQRALQSAATMTKIYDQVITRATSDLGRL